MSISFAQPMHTYYKKLGGRWKVQILIIVARKPMRFNKIKQLCYPISSNSLIRNLKKLEQDGLIYKKENTHVTYHTTPVGAKISKIILQVRELLLTIE